MLLSALSRFAASCDLNAGGSFFGIPHWYQYLQGETDSVTGKCVIKFQLNSWYDAWAIAFGIVNILMFIAGFVAVGFVIYGGFQYMTSQGEPDKTAAAKNTITNAIVGLVIVLLAIPIIAFIGGKF